MRSYHLLAAALALLAPVLLHAEEQPAAAGAGVPTVTVAPAEQAEIEARVPLSGSLVARQIVQVYPQVSGLEIKALTAEAGDRVRKGQELARLSDETLSAQLAQAEAELQRASAGVGQAKSQIDSAAATLTQAATAAARARTLRRSGSGTQATLDDAAASEAGAQAAAASARDGLAVAEAAQAQAQAALDLARLNLGWTRITAPVDGRVTARAAEPGGIASPTGEPMFTLVADGSIEFAGEVIESTLPSLRVGQETRLDVAGVGPVVGSVRQLPAAVDPVTRLGIVRVALPDDPRLLTGLFASGEIVVARRRALTVPATAVLSDAQGDRVQVVRGGTVETRPVQAGLLWQGRREILSGLEDGETVILRAGAFFATGDQVAAAAETADAGTSAVQPVAPAPAAPATAAAEAAPAAAPAPTAAASAPAPATTDAAAAPAAAPATGG